MRDGRQEISSSAFAGVMERLVPKLDFVSTKARLHALPSAGRSGILPQREVEKEIFESPTNCLVRFIVLVAVWNPVGMTKDGWNHRRCRNGRAGKLALDSVARRLAVVSVRGTGETALAEARTRARRNVQSKLADCPH